MEYNCDAIGFEFFSVDDGGMKSLMILNDYY
jgi:hypothetical protein